MPGVWIGLVAVGSLAVAGVAMWLYWSQIQQGLPDEYDPASKDNS